MVRFMTVNPSATMANDEKHELCFVGVEERNFMTPLLR